MKKEFKVIYIEAIILLFGIVLSRKGIFRGMLIVKKSVTGKEHLRIRDDFLITQKI